MKKRYLSFLAAGLLVTGMAGYALAEVSVRPYISALTDTGENLVVNFDAQQSMCEERSPVIYEGANNITCSGSVCADPDGAGPLSGGTACTTYADCLPNCNGLDSETQLSSGYCSNDTGARDYSVLCTGHAECSAQPAPPLGHCATTNDGTGVTDFNSPCNVTYVSTDGTNPGCDVLNPYCVQDPYCIFNNDNQFINRTATTNEGHCADGGGGVNYSLPCDMTLSNLDCEAAGTDYTVCRQNIMDGYCGTADGATISTRCDLANNATEAEIDGTFPNSDCAGESLHPFCIPELNPAYLMDATCSNGKTTGLGDTGTTCYSDSNCRDEIWVDAQAALVTNPLGCTYQWTFDQCSGGNFIDYNIRNCVDFSTSGNLCTTGGGTCNAVSNICEGGSYAGQLCDCVAGGGTCVDASADVSLANSGTAPTEQATYSAEGTYYVTLTLDPTVGTSPAVTRRIAVQPVERTLPPSLVDGGFFTTTTSVASCAVTATPLATSTCVGGDKDGLACNNDYQCQKSDGFNDSHDGTCTGTSTICSAGIASGDVCAADSDCPVVDFTCSNDVRRCADTTGNICNIDSDCPIDGATGEPYSCMNTCEGGLNAGLVCSDSGECPAPDAVCGGSTDQNLCSGGANDGMSCLDSSDCPGGSVTLNFSDAPNVAPSNLARAYIYWGDRKTDALSYPDDLTTKTHNYNRNGIYNIRVKTIDLGHNELDYTTSQDTDLQVDITTP